MIHLACNIDSNFVRHCAVTLVSLFENNRNGQFSVHIVGDGLSPADGDTLARLCARYGNESHFYTPPAGLLDGFSIRAAEGRISMAAYYRCMLSALLPEQIGRVLYLDCDIVVEGDITPLWETDLSDLAVACVEDVGSGSPERYERLCYDPAYRYFNSGVLLVNLDYWRRHRVDRLCIDYFHAHPERIRFNDQDLLNAVLHEHTRYVDRRWNMQDGFYRYGMDRRSPDPEAYREELRRPVVLHFTNKKPWRFDSLHPLRDRYFHYLDLTPWQGLRPDLAFGVRLRRALKLLPYKLGLRRPKYLTL
jgi:lipopolysaccharide biosynthesis glycosyltransferase